MGLFFLHTSSPPLAPYPSPNSSEAEMMGERRLQDAPQNAAEESDLSRVVSQLPGGVWGRRQKESEARRTLTHGHLTT